MRFRWSIVSLVFGIGILGGFVLQESQAIQKEEKKADPTKGALEVSKNGRFQVIVLGKEPTATVRVDNYEILLIDTETGNLYRLVDNRREGSKYQWELSAVGPK